MKTLLSVLALTTALTVPGLAHARPVILTTNLNAYGGDGAYLALHVTDAQGTYMGSLWMAAPWALRRNLLAGAGHWVTPLALCWNCGKPRYFRGSFTLVSSF